MLVGGAVCVGAAVWVGGAGSVGVTAVSVSGGWAAGSRCGAGCVRTGGAVDRAGGDAGEAVAGDDVMGGGYCVDIGGIVPASVPGALCAGGAEDATAFGSMVKAVVVSAFVPVSGGSVSPGPWIVEVTPAAAPSWTVS